jgi:hypothetical protein
MKPNRPQWLDRAPTDPPSMRDGKQIYREAPVHMVNFVQTAAGSPVMLARSNCEVAK